MIILTAALALAAQQTDRANNRFEALSQTGPAPMEPSEGSANYCSGDRLWCAALDHNDDGWTLRLRGRGGARRNPISLPSSDATSDRYAIWPNLIRSPDGSVLLGVLHEQGGGFSGGGWSTAGLILFRITPDAAGPVLDVPLRASATIRACFGARDTRSRRGACQDEYTFDARLSLDPGNESGTPRLRYTTVAETYPGRRSREEDSSLAPPLRRQDLVHWRSQDCSYDRLFRFDPAAGRYLPESPLPACADFLDFE